MKNQGTTTAILLLLAVACGQSAPAQETAESKPFDLEIATRAPPADVAALEERAFAALNSLIGRMRPSTAVPELIEAANRGSAAAMAQLGFMYLDGEGVPKNLERAQGYFRQAAERGSYAGQLYIGGLYLFGEGVEADAGEARAWLEAAANQDDAFALYTLAQLYASGTGVAANDATRFALLSRSAALGEVNALRDLGLELLRNTERRDPARAMAILEQAAEQEPAVAYLVGYQYLTGSLIGRDVALGAQWISSAADRGHAPAEVMLADMQESGIVAEGDPERARQRRAEIIASSSPEDQNEYAWRYSVSPEDSLRNGRLAVEIMEGLLASAEMVNAARLDTLAAAYAEVGRFEDAAAKQQEAIDRMVADSGPAASTDPAFGRALSEFRARLEGYRAGQAYREPY